ncbi:MAG TPA: PQQ-binding-like beta-propeller repeat protein [Steroidobacteraceae bacterium]|nr:PQQ-binding-like beta-propeller repeat protein [Steroidobacteraceae bacterium]
MAIRCVVTAIALSTVGIAAAQDAQPPNVEWRQYGGSQGFDRYSPLDLINRRNVGSLKILWKRPALDASLTEKYPDLVGGDYFRSTPIMVNGVLYASDGVGFAEAFDARTGKTLWVQKPVGSKLKDAAGFSTRGVAYWEGKTSASVCRTRIFSIHGDYLNALDAKTGQYCHRFGVAGRVNLRYPGSGTVYFNSGGPLVVGNVVVLGGTGGGTRGGDYGDQMKSVPEAIRAYDAVTGKLLWQWSPMPAEGDPARASWGAGSAGVAGGMGAYGTLSADEELGYVYVPLKTPTPPAWGGWRPGDNRYATSVVALDVKTGKKIWDFQLTHHDLWHYDVAAPPVLGNITVDGRPVKALMQTGKNSLLFTLDRVTGKPVWPVVEKPVPQSKIPGEQASPTQPFPTKPTPLSRTGFSLDDVIDFTPELHKEALEILKQYTYGPMYSPPTIYDAAPGHNKGTLTLPGSDGGCNWNCGAFDPETHTYYTIAVNVVSAYAAEKPTAPGATMTWRMREDDPKVWVVPGPHGLPLIKPPYGVLEAINMDTGEYRWQVPNGDGPRDNPALKDLHLPPLGTPGRAAPLVTKSLIFVGESSTAVDMGEQSNGYGDHFRAYDKHTGQVAATLTLPAGTTAAPMTYAIDGKQYVVVAVGGNGGEAQWVAMGL